MVLPNTGHTPEFRHMKGADVEKGALLGTGAFGAVYKARHREYGEVALKVVSTDAVIDKDDEKELTQEAYSLARVPNQYVTLLYGVILEPGNYSLVMEFVEHGSLDKFMKKVNIPWELKIRMIRDITCGMNFLHSFTPKIIHRDLKMQNILVNGSLHVKIADLGLAKWRTFSKKYMKKRSKDRTAGTITHIPPENLLDINKKATETFDVYSFGILLWEIITGKEPYEACGGNEALLTVGVCQNQNRPSDKEIPEDCPDWLKDLMKRCYHQDPEQRPLFPESYKIVHKRLTDDYTEAMIKDAVHVVHRALHTSDRTAGMEQERKVPTVIAQPSSPDGTMEATRQLANLQFGRTTPETLETDAVTEQPSQEASSASNSTHMSATGSKQEEPSSQGAAATTGVTAVSESQYHTDGRALRARGKTADDKAKCSPSAAAPPTVPDHAASRITVPTQDSMSPPHDDERVKKGKVIGPPSGDGDNESFPTRNRVGMPAETTAYQDTNEPGLPPGVFPGAGMQPPHYPYTMPVAGGFMIYSQAAHMPPMNFSAAMPGTTPQGGFSCVKTGSDGSTTVISMQGQMDGVQIGDKNVMYVNSGGRGQVRGTGGYRRVPPRRVVAGKPITTDTRVITKEDITVISENLGSTWRKLGRHLGFTEGKLDAFDSDYAIDGLQEKIYQMLVAWRRMGSDDATAAKLAEALCSIGKADVAVYL
ncbi:receptor-interacting serine/threonine-protein kinase 1-like [Branchiostoma floridae]|uniref:Receptor-interacting serine/threonine-protein kinase 1-like n=1 Tax=Branchiostoma floridae TaxID=7739 RepID=A0A9J7LCD6_BRAFL|nr:receptor-interacting serine/threonine-protein kinase 1-like [Branchiostoma floridae]